MGRFADALMNNQAFARGRLTPELDLFRGGQHGYTPNHGEWVSTTHYVRRNLVCLLLEAPKGFQDMPDPDYMVSALKSLVEVQALSWDGFNMGLEVEWNETAVSGGNEMFQDIVNVTRTRTQPKMKFKDLYGRPGQNFLDMWIRYLMMDPDTKAPMLSTIAGLKPNDMLADMYAATMLFYEPDPTYTKIAKSWLVCNMMPKGTGPIEGKRDLTAAGEPVEVEIEWSGLAMSGLGIDAFAQQLLDQMLLANANPFLRNSYMTGITADVASSIAGGYKATMEDLGADVVQPSGL